MSYDIYSSWPQLFAMHHFRFAVWVCLLGLVVVSLAEDTAQLVRDEDDSQPQTQEEEEEEAAMRREDRDDEAAMAEEVDDEAHAQADHEDEDEDEVSDEVESELDDADETAGLSRRQRHARNLLKRRKQRHARNLLKRLLKGQKGTVGEWFICVGQLMPI